MNPYSHTLMPLDLAKRMTEQRGGHWRIEFALFLEILRDGRHLSSVLIVNDAVKYLDITYALARS